MAPREAKVKMPISATGNSPDEAGFTLVELMVVMVIIGLMSAAVVIAMPDPRGKLRDDTNAFAARLVAARDLSIVGGHDIGVRIDASGYGFAERRLEGWRPSTERALAPHRWGQGIEALAAVEGDAELVFDTTGLATPAAVTLRRDGESARVSVDSAGAVRIDAR
jgi:general secretion pathway protein H